LKTNSTCEGAGFESWRWSQQTEDITMRKTVIALAAAAALMAGSTMAALAHGGGHGGGGGGGHGGGFGGHMGGGHWGGGGFGHAAFAHSGGWGHQAFRFHGNRVAFRHHRFFRGAFFGAGYDPYYAYDDSCHVWTPWGWRWVCNNY
jgi:hypothetical protein